MRLVLFCVLFLAACASGPKVPGAGVTMGDAVEQPSGFIELCQREPSAPECGDMK